MLSRAGLGDDAPGAEAARKQRLADGVVDLVRAWVSAVGRPTQPVSCAASSAWKSRACSCSRTPRSSRSSAGISVSGT